MTVLYIYYCYELFAMHVFSEAIHPIECYKIIESRKFKAGFTTVDIFENNLAKKGHTNPVIHN